MGASGNGHLNVVRTLLEAGALVNANSKVRNQNDDDYDNSINNHTDDDDDDDDDDVCYRCIYVNNG